MRKLLTAVASAALLSASTVVVWSDPDDAAKHPAPGATEPDHVEPGKVGPGSEKNSQVSPTSPTIPMHAQPPPDINLPADSGSSSGASGSSDGSGAQPGTNNPPPPETR